MDILLKKKQSTYNYYNFPSLFGSRFCVLNYYAVLPLNVTHFVKVRYRQTFKKISWSEKILGSTFYGLKKRGDLWEQGAFSEEVIFILTTEG